MQHPYSCSKARAFYSILGMVSFTQTSLSLRIHHTLVSNAMLPSMEHRHMILAKCWSLERSVQFRCLLLRLYCPFCTPPKGDLNLELRCERPILESTRQRSGPPRERHCRSSTCFLPEKGASQFHYRPVLDCVVITDWFKCAKKGPCSVLVARGYKAQTSSGLEAWMPIWWFALQLAGGNA